MVPADTIATWFADVQKKIIRSRRSKSRHTYEIVKAFGGMRLGELVRTGGRDKE